MMMIRLTALLVVCVLLASCSSTTRDGLPSDYRSFDVSGIPNATPKVEPRSKYGNPASYVVLGKRYTLLKNVDCYHAKGIASWYGTMFHKRLTSSREPYDMYKMTAANKILPLPTYVYVHNLENGRTIVVRVNDRGPFHDNRIIDLSFAAAKKLDMLGKGTALVEIAAIDPAHPNLKCNGTSRNMPVAAHHGKPKLYLQLGAFSMKASADRLAQQVDHYTQRPIQVYESSTADRHLFKVQIGPLKDVDELDALTAQLKQHGFGEAYAVVR